LGEGQLGSDGGFSVKIPHKEPIRQCLVTGERHPKSALLRFCGVEGLVVVDVQNRLPGRGFWLLPSKAILQQAIEKKLFQKRSRGRLKLPPDLLEAVSLAIEKEAKRTISIPFGQKSAIQQAIMHWNGSNKE
jgi:predicted RNA-binding protein YlxR (DUF448 family)